MKKDPKGLCWFPITRKKYTHQEALEYAESMGLRLPTVEEIEAARDSTFDLGGTHFWSSSVVPDDPDYAHNFDGFSGYIYGYYRGDTRSVRCVASEKELHDREFNSKLEGMLKD